MALGQQPASREQLTLTKKQGAGRVWRRAAFRNGHQSATIAFLPIPPKSAPICINWRHFERARRHRALFHLSSLTCRARYFYRIFTKGNSLTVLNDKKKNQKTTTASASSRFSTLFARKKKNLSNSTRQRRIIQSRFIFY